MGENKKQTTRTDRHIVFRESHWIQSIILSRSAGLTLPTLLSGINLFYRTLNWISNESGQASFSNQDCTQPKLIFSSGFKWVKFYAQLFSWSLEQWETDFRWERGQWEFIHLPSEDRAVLLRISKIKRNCALRSMYYRNQK